MSKVIKLDSAQFVSHELHTAIIKSAASEQSVSIQLNESLKRPEVLTGRTYKVKTPLSEHAIYVTINDVILNEDTAHERRAPFEIFINSKDTTHFQWVVAQTRLLSAVFRKGGDITFIIDEMKSVFDPNGGYMSGKYRAYVPSLVAEIGYVIESHFQSIGLLDASLPDENVAAFIEEKKAAFVAEGGTMDNAARCGKCGSESVVMAGGCPTCLTCGDSKCG